MSSGRRALVMLAVGVVGLGPTHAIGAHRPARFPAAGDLVHGSVVVRAAPREHAPVIRVLHEFRKDFRLQIVLAVRQVRRRHTWWVELSLPGRPNEGRGWVPRASVQLHRARRFHPYVPLPAPRRQLEQDARIPTRLARLPLQSSLLHLI